MSEETRVAVNEHDFDSMVGSAHRFSYARFKDRLKLSEPGKPEPAGEISADWAVAYALDLEGATYEDVMSAAAFLQQNRHAYELASEATEDGTTFWLLTNYTTRLWTERLGAGDGKEQSSGE